MDVGLSALREDAVAERPDDVGDLQLRFSTWFSESWQAEAIGPGSMSGICHHSWVVLLMM